MKYFDKFAKSPAMCARRAGVFYVPTCPHSNVPKTCQLLNFTCQIRANLTASRANVPIFNLLKSVAIFQLFFKIIIFVYMPNTF